MPKQYSMLVWFGALIELIGLVLSLTNVIHYTIYVHGIPGRHASLQIHNHTFMPNQPYESIFLFNSLMIPTTYLVDRISNSTSISLVLRIGFLKEAIGTNISLPFFAI